jgi:hypothetical protein
MNQKEKINYMIEKLENRLATYALMQRNYQKHYNGKIKEKLNKDADICIQRLNNLRNELHAINATEPKPVETIHKKRYGENVVAVGESIVIIG